MTSFSVSDSGVPEVDILLAQFADNAPLAATLLDDDDAAVDLTDCTVMVLLNDNCLYSIYKEDCVVESAEDGTVSYAWTNTDIVHSPIDLQIKFKVTDVEGVVTFYPSTGYGVVRVSPADATVVTPLNLTSTATGLGASLVGISDDDGQFDAVDVEGALAEVKAIVDAGQLETDTAESHLRNLPIHLRAVEPDAAGSNPYVNATPLVITLPDVAKANQPVGTGLPATAFGNAYARAGTGTLGPLAGANSQTPSAGQYSVSPTGDFLFNPTDAFTSVDVSYFPERYDVVEATYSCTAGTGVVGGLPSGIIFILEAEALVGSVTGECKVGFPASTAPTTGAARLSLGKTGVFFCIADAVTSVRLKLGVIPEINI